MMLMMTIKGDQVDGDDDDAADDGGDDDADDALHSFYPSHPSIQSNPSRQSIPRGWKVGGAGRRAWLVTHLWRLWQAMRLDSTE